MEECEKLKITIITVCYNSSATIEQTFKSVQDQSYENIEYIVVDGNSTDGTVEIINRYQNIITQWISEPDDGLYDAMNKGIALATGDYIGIINSDDIFFDSEVVGRIANYLKNKNIDACVGDVVQSKHNSVLRKISSKNWNPIQLKNGFMTPHPALFIKRSILNTYDLYRTDFKIGADYELIVRYFLKHKISWKYSGIVTHNMLIGGVSTSGYSSYKTNTKEIIRALKLNEQKPNIFKIYFRIIWKLAELIK
ncbi:glycosyltransferase family 2 protein [Acinetobacter ursingii]|uniref:glycosyltransferase family 2 protein n=2 Tax=Acinetobacter ursingii TaxID=108980 RepID=UPI001C07F5F8|nr:glycosyltransferase family 2 protein [Acinetobacter ursingii]